MDRELWWPPAPFQPITAHIARDSVSFIHRSMFIITLNVVVVVVVSLYDYEIYPFYSIFVWSFNFHRLVTPNMNGSRFHVCC